MTEMPDSQLLLRAREGSSEAIAVLYGRYAAVMHRACRSYASGAVEPEDIVHDAWIRVIDHLPRLSLQTDFRAWAVTVAKNLGRDVVIRNRRSNDLLRHYRTMRSTAEEQGPPLITECDGAKDLLAVVLDGLSARQRLILQMHIAEHRPSHEVAAVMDCAPTTVRTTCHHALTSIRKAMPPSHRHRLAQIVGR